MYADAIPFVICILYVYYGGIFVFVYKECPSRILLQKNICVPAIVSGRKETFADRCRSVCEYEKHFIAHASIDFLFWVGCPFLSYVIVGAYPTNISRDIMFSCAYSTKDIHILHNSSCRRVFRHKVAQKNGFKSICIRLTYRRSTLKK